MITFHARELAQRITVILNVKGLRELTWRIKIARFLFWLGATIAWMNIEFENDPIGYEE